MEIRPMELFSEPSGWETARVSLLSAVAFFGIYAYFEVLYNSGLASTLVIGAAAALSGIAEFVPKDRRRVAGALRVTAIGILVALMLRSMWRIAA
ncbi:hypothetical protein [Natrinema marinum]|uniref:hypothetical protein n=1 Tax=Natrinema marinum TaxID=2961598 RepID=UPI0020C89B80|nr:hypothetical protein [Natrinema marinum]